jgi:glycosyltransferase involved in cell wall biosynthesis
VIYRIFTPDPYAAEEMNRLYKRARKAARLPEPVRVIRDDAMTSRLMSKLSIEQGRRIFLFLGAMAEWRGIRQLLQALQMIPEGTAKKLCLLLIGPSVPANREYVNQKLSELAGLLPMQIIREDRVIHEDELASYYQIADTVLILNPRHVGSSGNLLQAAGAQKPVLATDYGLIGKMIRDHRLGLAVDTTVPNEIAWGIRMFVEEPGNVEFDPRAAASLAAANTPEMYAQTLIEQILGG